MGTFYQTYGNSRYVWMYFLTIKLFWQTSVDPIEPGHLWVWHKEAIAANAPNPSNIVVSAVKVSLGGSSIFTLNGDVKTPPMHCCGAMVGPIAIGAPLKGDSLQDAHIWGPW